MIHAHHIKKHFGGIVAIDDVSFVADNGNVTGIIGPNGSGKSTLINVLTGMTKKDAGNITKNGPLSRTFQDARVWDNITVEDAMLIATETRSSLLSLFFFRTKRKEIKILLERVDLYSHIKSATKHLSYGQRKLLEIARALATGANTLFLDEPFAGLSPHMVETVKEVIKEEKAKGKAIILVEHDMSVIRALCDKVYVLDSGKLIAEGTAEKVLADKNVIEAYLGD
jgi:ABC-type branched-subunit amino acid transport system ATPase component